MRTPFRRSTRPLALLSLVALLTASLTGCEPSPCCEQSDQLALVVGVRTGSAVPLIDEIPALLASIDAEGDSVAVIAADGEPRVVFDLTLPEISTNSDDREEELGWVADDVGRAVGLAQAQAAEVDQAESISLAASTFETPGGTIVLLDSGLQTTGPFSMQGGGLFGDAGDRVTTLEESGALPDLAGTSVSFPMLGLTSEPQDPVTEEARGALTGQWQTFVERAGGEFSSGGGSAVASPQSRTDLPVVTPVPIERPAPVAAGCRWTLGDGTIGFVQDEPEFLEKAAAEATIAAAAAGLAACEGRWTVVGSTSSARGEEVNVPLSEARVLAVAVPLAAQLGVDIGTIEVKGFGGTWPCRVPDRDDAGVLLQAEAAANRVVVVSRGLDVDACA
ncbi:hypothetical protein [Rathayibacter sp. Leaf296]|uniref:hypothetical protein n=1 Tax=Rathayibacter sp. Leaf296 TaxID=1736327 RepID=UPI000702B5BE|nr:hypothetical protein [Rathayibacter sp. Leaf296]KQQ09774.1 hypothetical protein ASF46_01220 [Rathayibacter sp. Leaf296]